MEKYTSYLPVPQPVTEVKHRKRVQTRAIKAMQAEYSDLLALADNIKNDIFAAETNFDMVCDPKATDIYIYRIRAAQTRYEDVLNQLKILEHKIEYPEEYLI